MSANIPFEIQEQIIKRILPVKSLIRFRSVAKQWKSLIDSSEFINHHSQNQSHPHHLLVTFDEDRENKYVLIVDDDSFPQNKCSVSVSPIGRAYKRAVMTDSSHGLVCLHSFFGHDPYRLNQIIVWNPSIKKSFGIMLEDNPYALGFGVRPKTCDPKIVNITFHSNFQWKVDVFRLSSKVWRSVSLNLINYPHEFSWNQVIIDGVIHWIVSSLVYPRDRVFVYWIVSFDLTSEEFEVIKLPDCFGVHYNIRISKLNECLVFVCDARELDSDVWMMSKDGDSNPSFTKLFKVNVSESFRIIGFRKNGELVITRLNRRQELGSL